MLRSNSRYSLRTLLVAAVVVSAYFPLANAYDWWFTTTYDSYYVNSVLTSQIHNGDSVDTVASHFTSLRELGKGDADSMRSVTEIWRSNNWSMEVSDQYYHFATPGGAGTYLQFRNGRLVNLWNRTYSDVSKIAEVNGYSLPHPIFRFGLLPLYVIFVACIAFVLAARSWVESSRGVEQELADGM